MKKYSNNPLEKCIVSINVSSFLNYFDVFCNLTSTNYQIRNNILHCKKILFRKKKIQKLIIDSCIYHYNRSYYNNEKIIINKDYNIDYTNILDNIPFYLKSLLMCAIRKLNRLNKLD